jgi:hypothetical protein
VEFVEAHPADRITHRDQDIHARLDQHSLIDGQIDFAVRFRFIAQNPRRQGCRAVEPVRQQPKGTLCRLGYDLLYRGLLDEDPVGEEYLEINGRWLPARLSVLISRPPGV